MSSASPSGCLCAGASGRHEEEGGEVGEGDGRGAAPEQVSDGAAAESHAKRVRAAETASQL